MRLAAMDLPCFLEEVASSSPAPGGGSVAALNGALGAALGSMVCQNALTKKKVDREAVERLLQRLQSLQASLLAAVDADTDAFNLVMKALRIPKEQREERQQAIAQATKQATVVPLHVAEHCVAAMEILVDLITHARKGLASDLGTGLQTLHAGLEGAAYNVMINLPQLTDREFAQSASKRLARAQTDSANHLQVVKQWVDDSLA